MQLLIATGSQRLCPRREAVVPSHYREVEAITDLLPHHRLLWTLVEGEVPALIELPNRISREHSEGQRRRRVRFTQSFDQFKHRTLSLHPNYCQTGSIVLPIITPGCCTIRLPARGSDTLMPGVERPGRSNQSTRFRQSSRESTGG